MHFYKVVVPVAVAVLIGSAMVAGYGSGGSGYGSGSGSFGGSSSVGVPTYRASSAGRGPGQNEAPKPYSFDYNAADGEGNSHYRNEQGDQNGNVRGTYGYTDAHGLYRVVEYVADENGYRATIKTNEPGVDGKESPADVQVIAEQPPAGVQSGAATAGRRPSGSAPMGFSVPMSGAGKPKSGY